MEVVSTLEPSPSAIIKLSSRSGLPALFCSIKIIVTQMYQYLNLQILRVSDVASVHPLPIPARVRLSL